jgi:hypothetical protein
MMHKLAALVLLLFLVSCGDSPFLDKDTDAKVSGNSGLQASSAVLLGDYKVEVEFDGDIVLYDNNNVIITFKRETQFTDPKNNFHAYLWMPDHGHGSFPIKVERLGKGIYKMSEVYFTMPGYWDLHLQFKEDDEILDEYKWPINL